MTHSDAEFMRSVESCELESLSHRDHIRLAWLTLQRAPLLATIESLRHQFAAFAKSKGKPMVYHETITWAFTLIINERIERGQGGDDWREFIALNPDLAAGKSILDTYYDAATLDSQLARRTFILPRRETQVVCRETI